LSDDAYRYIWDGRVQAAGINPYRYIPADQNLEKLRDTEIYPKINRKEYAPTIYPPAAEAIFLLTTRISESVIWMKTTMVAFEALTVWALMSLLASFGLPRHRVLIYAWHPLAVWEFAGSGHLDAIAIAFVALALLARRRDLKAVTGLLLAGATLVKLYPVILFPALYRRWDWKLPALFVAATLFAYTPYLGVGIHGALGYLPGYMQEEGLTSGNRFFVLAAARRVLRWDSLPEIVFIGLAAAVLLALGLWCLRRRERGGLGVITKAFVLATVFTALLSPRYAWYFTWLIPFLCFVPAISVYYLTAASFILYWLWLDSARIFSLNLALYAPFAVLAGVQFWVAKARVGRPQKNPG
jgi:alpha-1,6-mannosyltransferase